MIQKSGKNMTESKYKCPSCHKYLFAHRDTDMVLICCENEKCLQEMQDGASAQTESQAYLELKALYEEIILE